MYLADLFSDLFSTWQGLVVSISVLILVLYGARKPAHNVIQSLCRAMYSGLHLMAKSALMAEKRVIARNRAVLMNTGREAVERVIEREFHRVNAVVKHDLGGFPVLQRTLSENISRINEDYQVSSKLAPPPPEWVKAVEGVAKLTEKSNDVSLAHILKEIHKTTKIQFKEAMEKYQKAIGIHHSNLNKLMPYWRQATQALEEVGKTITGIHERAKVVDNRMDEYEQILSKTDTAERTLTSSSLTQFFISGFVLLIAMGGIIINFHLIALPMSEMVGASSYLDFWIWKTKIADVAALVIILVEVAMGLYLMESLRITRLFPVIGQMDDKMRYRMIWISFTLLFILASIESSLAFMRDRIAGDMQALRQSLAGSSTLESSTSMIPLVGQMVMGFILPFTLTFVAIPLESFVNSCRTVIGISAAVFLRWLAFFLRLLGSIIRQLGNSLVNIYDMLIFIPLWFENIFTGSKKESGSKKERETIKMEEVK